MFISTSGLCPLDASNSYPTPSWDDQGCLQVLPNVPYPQHCSKFLKVYSWKHQSLTCSEKIKVSVGRNIVKINPLWQIQNHTPSWRIWEVLQWRNLLNFGKLRIAQFYLLSKPLFMLSCCSPSVGRGACALPGARITSLFPGACPLLVHGSHFPVGYKWWGRWLPGLLEGGTEAQNSGLWFPFQKLDRV